MVTVRRETSPGRDERARGPWRRLSRIGAASVIMAGAYAATDPPIAVSAAGPATLVGQASWGADGVWLQGDLHTHYVTLKTRGRSSVLAARRNGLDFLVSTEHAEGAIGATQRRRLAEFRREFPELLLLLGIEWNVPGGDHASIVVEPRPGEWDLLAAFVDRFDRKGAATLRDLPVVTRRMTVPEEEEEEEEDGMNDAGQTWGDLATAAAGLRWLAEQSAAGQPSSVVYLNHPGKHGWLTATQIAELHDAGLAGLASAPGHQNGDLSMARYTVDRHEPAVALVGGAYDRVLATGHHLGLSASSDFHVKRTSYLPGAFSRTLVWAPERSARGVIAGLAAGATATVLGGIVTALETRLSTVDGAVAAHVGQTLVVDAGTPVRVSIAADVPQEDFEGRPNRIDRVEIVANCAGEPRLVAELDGGGPGPLRVDWSLPAAWVATPGTCFIRVRGRRAIGGPGNDAANADYLFHVAPTWLRVRERPRGQT